jgi:hypothetical protein
MLTPYLNKYSDHMVGKGRLVVLYRAMLLREGGNPKRFPPLKLIQMFQYNPKAGTS